jgi:glycosyltransferase involved in cell wall biosynthesis
MSVAAVMLVRDEADILECTLDHLRGQVDACYVLDNRSTDGTTKQLLAMAARDHGWLQAEYDAEVGYWQARKTTRLARRALADGHAWVVPCDADERWEAPGGNIAAYLSSMGPDVQIVTAALYNHVPTDADDAEEGNPFRRLGWRLREPGALPKVAARTHPALSIHMGNHCADYGPNTHAMTLDRGLAIRHYSWRTPEQYVRKIRNGAEAYAATDLPATIGRHWRMWQHVEDDDALREHFDRWFFKRNPADDDELVYDPAESA